MMIKLQDEIGSAGRDEPLAGNFKETDRLGDLHVDGGVILRFLNKSVVRVWTEFIWLGIGYTLPSTELLWYQ
jgi:hypothetical protein